MPNTTEEIMKLKEDINRKIMSYNDPMERMRFIAEFQYSISNVDKKSLLQNTWKEVIKDYFCPKSPDGSLNKNLFETRLDEFARWRQENKVQVGEFVQGIQGEHSDDWIADKVSIAKTAGLNAKVEHDLLWDILNETDIDRLVEKAYPEEKEKEEDKEINYNKLLKNKDVAIENQIAPEKKDLYEKGLAYIAGNFVEESLDKKIDEASTEEEKKAAEERKEQWTVKQQELKRNEKPLSDEELKSEQIKTEKNIYDNMDLSFIGNIETVKQIRSAQNEGLGQLKVKNTDIIDVIEHTEKLLDGMELGNGQDYINLRSRMKELKESLYVGNPAPEKYADFINAYYGYQRSPEWENNPIQELSNLAGAVSDARNAGEAEVWASEKDSFKDIVKTLLEDAAQEGKVFNGKEDELNEYANVLKEAERFYKRMKNEGFSEEVFNSSSKKLNKVCEDYLKVKDLNSEEGKERYAFVQELWYANKRLAISNSVQNFAVNPDITPEKLSDSLETFRQNIQDKLDSFDNGLDRMNFIVEFQSNVMTPLINNDSPEVKVWYQILDNYLAPTKEDGSLDKEKFEQRLDEIAEWNVKNKIEESKHIKGIYNIHSAEWIDTKACTTKQWHLGNCMKEDILREAMLMSNKIGTLMNNAGMEQHQVMSLLEKRELEIAKAKGGESHKDYIMGANHIFGSGEGNIKDRLKIAVAKAEEKIAGAKTKQEKAEAEKQKAKAVNAQEKWEKQQQRLKDRESKLTDNQFYVEQVKNQKKMFDEFDLGFISDISVLEKIRKSQNKALYTKENKARHINAMELKVENSYLVEQIKHTEETLDKMQIPQDEDYNELRGAMGKLKEELIKNTSKTEKMNELGAVVLVKCGEYIQERERNVPDIALSLLGDLKNSVQSEIFFPDRESAWQNDIQNFDAKFDVLLGASGQRRNALGIKVKDSGKYSDVLNAAREMKERLSDKDNPMPREEFEKLNKNIKEACEKYLEVRRNPGTEDGKKRYAMVESIWSANSRLSSHYEDTVTRNPFSMKEDMQNMRKNNLRNTIAESKVKENEAAKNAPEKEVKGKEKIRNTVHF